MLLDDERTQVTLSPREREVAALVARGLSNKEVARELGLSDGTVKIHVHSIFQKLGTKSRYRLIADEFKWAANCQASNPPIPYALSEVNCENKTVPLNGRVSLILQSSRRFKRWNGLPNLRPREMLACYLVFGNFYQLKIRFLTRTQTRAILVVAPH
jgi:DNA-binding CsgD family transcriptional regulator